MAALVLLLAGVNVATFALFGWDKRAASIGAWRVREATLLTFALLGGALGGLLGQRYFRHKTRKQPFGALLLCAAALNVACALALLNPDLSAQLGAVIGSL